jgi:ribosome-binding protein aMBF1 (putative translation factor)
VTPLYPDANICNNADMSKHKPQPTLTDVLRTAIEQSGLTCYRIAKATNIDPANLGRFVRGDLYVRLDKADRLAAYLGLHLVPDPNAAPPEPTPPNRARPMLAKRKAKRTRKSAKSPPTK